MHPSAELPLHPPPLPPTLPYVPPAMFVAAVQSLHVRPDVVVAFVLDVPVQV